MKYFLILFFISALHSITSHSSEKIPEAVLENADLFNPFPVGFMSPPEQPNGWVALPPGRPFPSLLSDPRDLKIALRKNSRNELEADIGGYRSLAGWKGEIKNEKTIFHAGIEGNAYFVLQREGNKFPLLSSDGLIGIYGEAIRGLWLYQIRYTHISAHLSDGIFNQRQRFTYTRETLSLRVARQFSFLRAYLGYHFLANTQPIMPRSSLQAGAYSIFPWHWQRLHPYAGIDYRWKSEKEGSALNLVAGIALVSSLGAPPVRISASYLKGRDQRGQFFHESIRKFSLGLDMDF